MALRATSSVFRLAAALSAPGRASAWRAPSCGALLRRFVRAKSDFVPRSQDEHGEQGSFGGRPGRAPQGAAPHNGHGNDQEGAADRYSRGGGHQAAGGFVGSDPYDDRGSRPDPYGGGERYTGPRRQEGGGRVGDGDRNRGGGDGDRYVGRGGGYDGDRYRGGGGGGYDGDRYRGGGGGGYDGEREAGRQRHGGGRGFAGAGVEQGGNFAHHAPPMGGGGGMPDRMGTVGQNLKPQDWVHESLVNFEKNFYHEHPEVASMDEKQVQAMLQSLNATIEGKKPHPKPLRSWDYLTLPNGLLQGIHSAGFERPSPIQSIGWPAALSGRDMVGIAQTGSGKTLAYVLPGVVHITAQPELRPGDGPIGLVLAPTRELAMQIQGEVLKFTRSTNVRCTAVFGGVSRYGQASELRRGSEFVIATPGRLLDFLEAGVTNLKRVTYLCLDEADRMLDMGFEPQIRKVVSQIRPDRQTLMWSATWPQEIQRLARDFCREDPVKLTIGSEDLTTNADITQQIEVVGEYEKRERFMNWIKGVSASNPRILVFTETKRGADALCRELQYQQLSAAAIHGDKDQQQRDRCLFDFKAGRVNILIATDVAQRGLDIKDVAYVVNYDVPKTLEDYIHRIGRTGRGGAKGTAVTFFPAEAYTPDMIGMARKICKSMQDVGQEPPEALVSLTGSRM